MDHPNTPADGGVDTTQLRHTQDLALLGQARSDSSAIGISNSNPQLKGQEQRQTGQQQSYSPWDMPPIIQPVASNNEVRQNSGLKGFSNTSSTWPHFRSKPHPTITVPNTPTTLRTTFDMAAPSTPPRNSTYSNAEDSDNAMCTPTFGSSNSNYSRRNSAVSVMALDTPPPLSLMELENLSSVSGSSSTLAGHGPGHGVPYGSMSRSAEPGFGGGHGYPFPLFGMRSDAAHGLSRRSSRANSITMDSRHVRKPSEDTNMSDGGNNSGSERNRRNSPAVVPYERSVRRSALLPKPKGLLKVFSQLEEEVHHNRHEYDHERETTRVRKDDEDTTIPMDIGTPRTSRLNLALPLTLGMARRSSTSPLNPDQELASFQRQQEAFDRLFQQQQQQQHSLQTMQSHQDQLHGQSHPLQAMPQIQESPRSDHATSGSYGAHTASMVSSPSSPLLNPIATRSSKRKSSTCEERFDPYHSSHLKRRAVSPSVVSHRRSPSSSPARSHLFAHNRPKSFMFPPLPSPSGTTSFFRQGSHIGSSTLPSNLHNISAPHPINNPIPEGAGDDSDSRGGSGNNNTNGGPMNTSSTLNLQHTSRSFSELSLGIPENHSC